MNAIQISGQKGFSIIELLIASVIIVGVSALAFTTLSTSNEVVARNVNSYLLGELELKAFERAEVEAFNNPKSIQLFQETHNDHTELTAGIATLPSPFNKLSEACTVEQVIIAPRRQGVNVKCPGETGASHEYINLDENPLPVYIESSQKLCSIVKITPGNRAFQAGTSTIQCLLGLDIGRQPPLNIIGPEYLTVPVLGCPTSFDGDDKLSISSSPSCHNESLVQFSQTETTQFVISYENDVLAICGIQNSVLSDSGVLKLTLDNDCRQRSDDFNFTQTFLPASNLLPSTGRSIGYLFDNFNLPGPDLPNPNP